MPRIPLRTEREVGPVLRLVYRVARRRYGGIPEPGMAAAHHPGLLTAQGIHEMLVERAARRLPAELRDLVVHRVATVVGCSWCVDFGTMIATKAGISVRRHRELGRYGASAAFTPAEKLALEYADAMTAQPIRVDDDLVARLRDRFTDAEVYELTYLIALENMRARGNAALGITAQGYTSGDACPMPYDEQITAARTGSGSDPAPAPR
jgi:AhpD family alkylhydroperoxidase